MFVFYYNLSEQDVTTLVYHYNANGNRGVAAGLSNIQFVKDGERLSGKASAESEFEAMEDDEDELLGEDMPDFMK